MRGITSHFLLLTSTTKDERKKHFQGLIKKKIQCSLRLICSFLSNTQQYDCWKALSMIEIQKLCNFEAKKIYWSWRHHQSQLSCMYHENNEVIYLFLQSSKKNKKKFYLATVAIKCKLALSQSQQFAFK